MLLLLATAAVAGYMQELYFLVIPFLVLLGIYLVQNPHNLFYLLIASIPWSVEFNFTSSLGTDLPDEPLMLLISFAVLAWLIHQRKNFDPRMAHPLLMILLLQFIWTIITVVSSTDVIISTKYLLAKSWYLLAFVAAPLLLFRDEIVIKRTAIVLMSSMFFFMLVTLFRHAGNGFTFETINDSLHPFYRNHVNYSALLVFTVPVQLAVIRFSPSRKIRTIVSLALILTIGALYFSYARGAWMALAGGWLSYWLVRKRLLFASFLCFILISLLTVFYLKNNDRYLRFSPDYKSTIFHTNFREHLIATYQMKDVSTAERFYRWVAGVRMINDSWMTGLGPSTFYPQYKSYALPAFKTWVSRNAERSTVHNYFLLLIIEQGVIGLLLFLALLGFVFLRIQKIYQQTDSGFWKIVVSSAASILVMECIINFLSDMIETDKAGSIFYLCLAAVVIADWKTKKLKLEGVVKEI